jgi:hypothetical protein
MPRTMKVAMAIVILATVTAGAAFALGGRNGSEASGPGTFRKPHIDIAALGTQPGVPADPAERVKFLRSEVLAYSSVGYITAAQARRALREIRQTGTLGRSVHPVIRVRALTSLPPKTNLPPEVAKFVAYVGELTHSGPADPRSVRLLRTNLGTGGGDVYGVASASGSPCFILTGYGGTCGGGSGTSRTSVAWIIGGAHDGLPSIFVGLAADDVERVRLVVDGVSVPITLRSNVVFAEFPASAHDAVVTTTRAGGRTSSEALSLAN